MMISPTVKQDDDRIIKKDVTFVFDTSGSMGGEIEAVKAEVMQIIAVNTFWILITTVLVSGSG